MAPPFCDGIESLRGCVAASISVGMTGQMRGRFANFI